MEHVSRHLPPVSRPRSAPFTRGCGASLPVRTLGLAAWGLSAALSAQDGGREPLEIPTEWIRERVRARMAQGGIDAVSLGVVVGDQLVFDEGFGRTRDGAARVPDASSIYQIASISKTFTGLVANALIHQGVLDAEAPITGYLETVLQPEAVQRLAQVRVKHLLTHTSGVPNVHCLAFTHAPRPRFAGYTEAQLVADINSVRLERAPGEHFEYSNSGYAILGYVCERAAGKSYGELLRDHVTTPFGLAQTSDVLRPDQVGGIVDGAFSAGVSPWQITFGKVGPASSLVSNVTDLSALMIAQMEAFRKVDADGGEHPLVLRGGFSDVIPGQRYGYGMFEDVTPAATTYSHSGSVDGFLSWYGFSPAKNLGLVLLAASPNNPYLDELRKEIYAKLIGDTYEQQPFRQSLAQAVMDRVRGDGIKKGWKAGVDLLRTGNGAQEYYLSPDQMVRVQMGLIGLGDTAAAKALHDAHADVFPHTRKPLAVAWALTAAEDGADAVREQATTLLESPDYVLREDELNRAGYTLLEMGRQQAAIALFQLNVAAFPQAPNVYDSLADALFRSGDVEGARHNYEVALALDPSSATARDGLQLVAQAAANEAIDGGDGPEAAIRRTLEDYIQGSTNGQPERLKRAFHPDLNLYSIREGKVNVWAGTDYIADTKAGVPTGEMGTILDVDYENDIAVAKVEVAAPGARSPFVDYFMLIKGEQGWVIVHKMFTRRSPR